MYASFTLPSASRCVGAKSAAARRESFAFGGVVIAGGVIVHRPAGIAAGDMIGAGEIFHGISHVGVGIEQAGGAAAVTHRTRGREFDLHQAVIAARHDARIAAAFALDNAANQIFRNIVGGGVPGDQRVEITTGIEAGDAQVFGGSGRCGHGQRDANSCDADFANHVGSEFWGMAPCGLELRQLCDATAINRHRVPSHFDSRYCISG